MLHSFALAMLVVAVSLCVTAPAAATRQVHLPTHEAKHAATHDVASWYGHWHEGRLMADGCVFHAAALTAASRTLALGSVVRVSRPGDLRTVIVRITDRGPYHSGRTLDLSQAAAAQLGMIEIGVAVVNIELLQLGAGRAGCEAAGGKPLALKPPHTARSQPRYRGMAK